jgi:methionyl-tRNA synthetase
MLQPFMTNTPKNIFEQLGITDIEAMSFASIRKYGNIPSGTKVIEKGTPIFPRLEVEVEVDHIRTQMSGSVKEEPKKEEQVKEEAHEITIEDFSKVELKVGQIKECRKHPKADRLLVSQIDFGNEVRQIVSGIADHYTPENLVGTKVICVTNLKPVKLRGELSQGMVLAGSNSGVLSLATIDEKIPNGSIVK